ncbi:hypothetical protein HDU87_006996 [Geranomyces variabilis]|uniref:Uncharacterized protein n=1 Tax=Geranomyces variabilis TaxID=109894 RepID=A0AAD5TEI9_9FUNG|nr:hypothetical protein HDU87_006996 [Geranomyces variabilis]
MAADSSAPPLAPSQSPPSAQASQASSPPQSLFGRALGFLGLSAQPPPPRPSSPPPSQPADPQPRTPSPQPTPQSQSQPQPHPHPHPHPTLDIPNAIWENPYHPLPGPPKTPQERAQLQQLIQQERTALTTAVYAAKTQTQLSLAQAARRNCADADLEYNRCMLQGSWFERMRLCPAQKAGLDKCLEIQKQNLQLLGYTKGSLTARERAIIADEADQAYLQAMEKATAASEEQDNAS